VAGPDLQLNFSHAWRSFIIEITPPVAIPCVHVFVRTHTMSRECGSLK